MIGGRGDSLRGDLLQPYETPGNTPNTLPLLYLPSLPCFTLSHCVLSNVKRFVGLDSRRLSADRVLIHFRQNFGQIRGDGLLDITLTF